MAAWRSGCRRHHGRHRGWRSGQRGAVALALLAVFFASSFASAQDDPQDPADAARFRFGAIRFTPSISISNIGVDDNVFNQSVGPRSDTTGSFGPAIRLWAGDGRLRLSARSSNEYLYFRTYSGQRAWNSTNQFRLEVPTARITPYAEGQYVNARQRSGFEIDSRARRTDQIGVLGTTVRVSGRTSVDASVRQQRFAFDRDETFLGRELAEALDRTTTTERAGLRYTLTSLTTWVVTGESIQDEFRASPERDARSIRVLSGVEMKPFALVSGRVTFGVRRFNVIDEATPDHTGFVAETAARYALRTTAFDVRYARDVAFSYETDTPYYVLNDVGLSVTQRLTRSWEIIARGGHQTLDYTRNLTAPGGADRRDRGNEWGAGIGYRVGSTLRIGFDVNHYRRSAPDAPGHDYDGLRAGASLSYGLPQ